MTQKNIIPLPEGTVLAGRYVLGNPRAVSEAGIAYNAFDKKLRMPCEVFEFLPADCADRGRKGAVVPREGTDPKIFAEKCEKLRTGAIKRFQDSDSAIYDLIAANGSVYLVQVCAKNNAYPGNAVTPPADDPDDAVTREIGGLFAGGAVQPEENEPVSDAPTVVFPYELLQDTPETAENKTQESEKEAVPAVVVPQKPAVQNPAEKPAVQKQNQKPAVSPQGQKPAPSGQVQKPVSSGQVHKPAVQKTAKPVKKPMAEDDFEDEYDTGNDRKLNMKLMAVLLAGVVILLILGVIIFVSVLRQIGGSVDTPESLLGVPVVEIEDVHDGDYLIVGTGTNPQYAPGMVIEEKQDGNVLQVLVNGQFPAYVMPDLTGMTVEAAKALLNRTPLCNAAGRVTAEVQIEEVNHSAYASGAVVSQTPAAGDVVRADASVVIQIAVNTASSAADTEIRMPELCGKSYAAVMSGHPVLVIDRVFCADVPAGTVLHQYPAAGETWAQGGVCYVVVSAGAEMTYVPDMVYRTTEQAMELLAAMGLSVKTEYTYDAVVKEGLVLSQSMPGGTETAFGAVVTLTVSGDGKSHVGPAITNNTEAVSLQIGDTCTIRPDTNEKVIYHSSNPASVTVDDTGLISAVGAGSAVVTASIDGTAIAMPISVAYPDRECVYGVAQTSEEFSLSTLVENASTEWQWKILQGDGTLDNLGIFRSESAGTVIIGGTRDGESALILLTVKKIDRISVPKDLIKDAEAAKKYLEDKGLICVIKEEYSESHGAGVVLRIQYSGTSDDDEYHFAAGSTVTLIVSSGKLGVTSIAIAEKPTKLRYTVGDSLDTAGLVLAVTYEDGTVKNITSGYTVSYDFSSAGRKTVAVSFGDRKASFHVEVVANSPAKLSIVSLPDKTTYYIGDKISTVGLEVKVTNPDGTSKVFASGYTVSYNFDKLGSSEVIVSMDGMSASFTVTVVENKVEYLELVKHPKKIAYVQGDTFDPSGMQLRAYYADDSSALVTSGWSISVDLNTTMGDCPVVVTYGGKSVQFMVTVKAPDIQAVNILKAPSRVSYIEGDTIDLTGLVLSVNLSNGKTEKIAYPHDAISCKYDFSEAGEKTVTVTYLDYECTFKVKVSAAELEKLTVQTMPVKLYYLVGEKLDTTGMVLLAEYKNNIQKKITSGYTCEYDFSVPGDAKVTVTFEKQEVSFFVTVTKDALLYTDPASLSMKPGETQSVRIFCLLANMNASFSVSDKSVISVKPMASSLAVTALTAGESTITIQCGTLTTECKVVVSETVTADSFTAKLTVSDKTDQYFMDTLEITGSASADVEVEFTAVITYDPSVLHLADYGVKDSAVTLQYDGTSSIILSGKITVPKGQKVAVAYCLFIGTDTSACVLNIK